MNVRAPIQLPSSSDIGDLQDLGISVTVTFRNELLRFEDVAAVATLLGRLIAAANEEIFERNVAPDLVIVSDVVVSQGSLKFFAKLRGHSPTKLDGATKTAVATIVAAVIGAYAAMHQVKAGGDTVPLPPVSPQCVEMIRETNREFDETALQMSKTYTMSSEVSCNGVTSTRTFTPQGAPPTKPNSRPR